MMKELVFLILLGFSQVVFSEQSKSDKELYELQEKCGKTTRDEFRREWGNGIVNTKDSQMVSNYQSHYNKKLNKCFYLLTTTTYIKTKDLNSSMEMRSLWDIQENKSYGELDTTLTRLFKCTVGVNRCSSKEQWETLVIPYMND